MPTRFTSLGIKGTIAVAGVATLASIAATSVVNFTQTDGTSTGAVIQVAGLTRLQTFGVTCTNTGGNVKVSGGAKYDTCISRSPLSTTGTLVDVSLECGNSPKPYNYDLGFVKGLVSGTGVGITNLNNRATASGSLHTHSTGAYLWNPADYLKLGTLTSVPTTSGNDCKLWVTIQDKYGS